MNGVKTIDVRGLEHHQRESLIFPGVESLQLGQSARLVVEFNPVPLLFLLNARGEFQVGYEKEGPDEWVLKVTRTSPAQNQRAYLKEMLREMKQGEVSAEAKEKAKSFFQAVDAKTLGELEQELIREGVSHDEIRKSLCDIHLEVMRDSLVAKRIDVQPPHPVHTLMEEHKIIVDKLNELGDLLGHLKTASPAGQFEKHLPRLQNVAHHLVEAENHHLREEEVLFPALERHGVVEPPSIMKLDHVEFRQRKHELHQVAALGSKLPFEEFKSRVLEAGNFLTQELASHIFKEDNILYQIALQVLSAQEWEEIKVGCDKIGYCCFTPGDHAKKASIVELDLRPLPPPQRHQKIFAAWEGLKPGEALRIINDHDPKPLRYQFAAEYAGHHAWEYEQQGPKDWQVKITRV